MKFFTRMFNKIAFAGTFSLIQQSTNYLCAKVPPDNQLKIDEKHRQLIADVFNQSKRYCSSKHLTIIATPKSSGITASVTELPLVGACRLNISIEIINELAKKSDNSLSVEEMIKAISAHEAVHAAEDHEFIITCVSSFYALVMLEYTRHLNLYLRMPLLFISYELIRVSLARQMEYRADQRAVANFPELKEPLKETLSLLNKRTQTHFFTESLFSLHPECTHRIARLK